MRVKVGILGHFGEGINLLNGQTVKTKIITEELQNQLGHDQVMQFDTHGKWKPLLKAPFQVFQALKHSTNVVIFPAHNGLRIYAPLLLIQRFLFKNRKIHYVVIGGWLPQFLLKRRLLARILRKFDGIYVETSTMQKTLEAQGFCNVFVMPNCKKLTVLSENELVYPSGTPYKLCTFSRVMKEKGIEIAVDAVKKVNEQLGYTAYSLDIYGQVDVKQVAWFDDLKKSFPNYIRYGGVVPFDKSVEVLKEYFALLFPTLFYTEGIPGTIIDAYAAGIPVISAHWESCSDIVQEGETGWCYSFGNAEALAKLLSNFANQPELITALKSNCLNQAQKYTPANVVQALLQQTEGYYYVDAQE